MLPPPEVAAVIQEIPGEPGCHNEPHLLRSARSYARLVRQTMKIGLTALTLRLLREEKRRPPPAHCRLLQGDRSVRPSASCGAVV